MREKDEEEEERKNRRKVGSKEEREEEEKEGGREGGRKVGLTPFRIIFTNFTKRPVNNFLLVRVQLLCRLIFWIVL